MLSNVFRKRAIGKVLRNLLKRVHLSLNKMSSDSNQDEAPLRDIEIEGINKAKDQMKKMYNIWNQFGIDLDQKSSRATVVWNHVQNLLKDICDEENTLYEDIKKRIQNYTVKIQELTNVLAVTPKEPQGSLLQKEEMLRQELDTLTRLKRKRVESYQDLKKEEFKYSQTLNLLEHRLSSNTGVPSEDDLSELEQHVKMLKDEKDRRQKKLYEVKKKLTTILEITELMPESTLEKDILSGKETLYLTNETFKAMEEVIIKANKRKAELEDKKKALVEKLTTLWKRLKVEERIQVEFLSKHLDCRLSTIKSIEHELQRYEDINKQNIGTFVCDLRIELLQLWDRCYVAQPDRVFRYFSSTEMSDEVLGAHEKEVERWKKHYATVEHIFKKIEKRMHLWESMIIFENKAADPNRFRNREWNLLEEERERKRFERDLPALENKIFYNIETFEALNGSRFLYNGEDFRTFVTNQWTERTIRKMRR